MNVLCSYIVVFQKIWFGGRVLERAGGPSQTPSSQIDRRSRSMPGARAHDLITVVTGITLAPLTYSILSQSGVAPDVALANTGVLVGAHLLSGIMFSPDLDLDSRIDDRWGIFFWIWRPYMWFVPHRHRILSHGLAISQLLRLFYFYTVVVLLLSGAAWVL